MRPAKPFQAEGKWWIRVSNEFGKRKKKSFGSYADAMKALIAEQARVGEVKDGRRSPTPPDRTFDQLADYWLANRVPQKRSPKDHTSIIRCHLRPCFGPMKLREIGVADTDHLQVERLHLDKKTVANILTLFITTMNPCGGPRLAHQGAQGEEAQGTCLREGLRVPPHRGGDPALPGGSRSRR